MIRIREHPSFSFKLPQIRSLEVELERPVFIRVALRYGPKCWARNRLLSENRYSSLIIRRAFFLLLHFENFVGVVAARKQMRGYRPQFYKVVAADYFRQIMG